MNNIHTSAQLQYPVAVIGAGITGLACVRYLLEIAEGEVVLFDTRVDAPNKQQLVDLLGESNCFFGEFDFKKMQIAPTLLVSPGVDMRSAPWQAFLQEQRPVVLGDIELFLLRCEKPVVCISGTNGKSTVTALLAHFAQAQGLHVGVGGNYGVPALSLLKQECDVYVLELSSFQLDLIKNGRVQCACLLNVSPDHLDRYDNYEAYIAAKKSIFTLAENAIFNGADILTQPLDLDEQVNWVFNSSAQGQHHIAVVSKAGEFVIQQQGEELSHTSQFVLKGRHNAENLAAAVACVLAMGWSVEKAHASLSNFVGLPHRCEWVGSINGVSFINDSKATNVGATEAALLGLCEQYNTIYLLAGGVAKEQSFSALKSSCEKYVKAVFLFGVDALKIAESLSAEVELSVVSTMQEAVGKAHKVAVKGDLVLLSPACASFDQYANYQERGADFVRCVNALEAA